MKRLVQCLLALFACASLAQTQTTENVIYTNLNPAPPGVAYGWSGFELTESGGGGLSGGHVPAYNPSLGQFMFGYQQGTIGYAVALNTVLSGTGIQLSGIQYGMQYWNQDFSRGSLSTTISLQNNQGTVLESYYHSLPQTTEGWTNFDQTKTFTNPYLLSNIGYATATITGKDDRFWAGYYGPQVRNPYMRFTYTADICAANPLSSPDCPGYAAAFLTQQCTISALYNPACPGYAAAYFTQQCTANPLYDPACPGYQQAYKTQQCTANPLYATDCPGYAQAYFNQQCTANSLYDPACPGYQQAYFTQQCTANGLYSTTCPNYAEAYAKKNILNIGSTSTTSATTTAVVTESSTSTAKTDPVSIATTSTTTSTTSPTSVTSVTSVVSGGTTNATTAVVTSTSTQSTTSTTTGPAPAEAKKTDAEVKSATSTSTASGTSSPKSRAEAVARQVAREASEAKTFESQTATQSLVVGLMGFVPGFDAYGQARIVDVNAQQMARLYNRPTVDNRTALRRLTGASDRLHTDMVDQQYQLGK
jgi:hypothetical protein